MTNYDCIMLHEENMKQIQQALLTTAAVASGEPPLAVNLEVKKFLVMMACQGIMLKAAVVNATDLPR